MTTKGSLVISGIGAISSVGHGRQGLWQAFHEGRCGIKAVEGFDVSDLPSKLAAEVSAFDPTPFLGAKGLRLLDRNSLLALSASKLALDDGKVERGEGKRPELGIVLASSWGSLSSRADFEISSLREGPRRVNPNLFPNTVLNVMASQVGIWFGLSGACVTVSSGCAGVFDAFEIARFLVESSQVETVLVGGTEALGRYYFDGHAAIHRTSVARADRVEGLAPCSTASNGTILGEGAVLFVLEREETAAERGAPIYARYLSGRSISDLHRVRAGARGPALAAQLMSGALEESDIPASAIDFVSAAFSGSTIEDRLESHALGQVFGDRLGDIPVTAGKSMVGETFSASGAFQIAAALYAFHEHELPPTLNLGDPDPECRVHNMRDTPIALDARYAMMSCVGAMGENAAMVLGSA